MIFSSPPWLGLLTDIISIAGIPITLYQIIKTRSEAKKERLKREKEELRKNDLIEIILEDETNRKIILPTKIRRSFLTRQEVMGRIGAIPKIPTESKSTKQGRFNIEYTNTRDFIDKIDELYALDGKQLVVKCKGDEIQQFDIQRICQLEFIISGFNNENP